MAPIPASRRIGTSWLIAALLGCVAGAAILLSHAWNPFVSGDRYTTRDDERTFGSVSISSLPSPQQGPGGPILVITSDANHFSSYYAEILRNEGFNEFEVLDIFRIKPDTLQRYDLAILGEVSLNPSQVKMITAWVQGGGNLVAMRPDARLAAALGLRTKGMVLKDAYVAIDTRIGTGRGLVNETIQYHGAADLYTSDSGTALATLYRNATVSASSPAVFSKMVGKGEAAIFAYDLARSVVYTRQGNPDWAGMERDGVQPMRTDDLFYGAASYDPQPDWVNLDKVSIPSADEQQRLLANLILAMNARVKPLPRFWYFPRGLKAVVIMTGDDHGHGGTVGRSEFFRSKSFPGCSLKEWQCIRSSSNIFLGSITAEQAARITHEGFEVGLHIFTGCEDWPAETYPRIGGQLDRRISRSSADSLYTRQLAAFSALYPGTPPPVTSRIDCIVWGDYDTQPQVEFDHGIRLDTNYYYWPRKWVKNRPGMFTGSGLPMRLAKSDGTLIDVYQAATQMTDESGQTYPFTIDTLLDNALGPAEFYGAFTANMHTDEPESLGAEAIVTSAQKRGVPIVTAAQMLHWLDGRNRSSFQDLRWKNSLLQFTVFAGAGSRGLQVLLPRSSNGEVLAGITIEGAAVNYQIRSFAGLEYAAFPALRGRYEARYMSR